jgi:hypothetical protein
MLASKSRPDLPDFDTFDCLTCHTMIRNSKPQPADEKLVIKNKH